MTHSNLSNGFLILNNEIVPITREVTFIGRSLGNHVVIRDPIVSRKHAEIHLKNNEFVLVDLNSTGGTFLNNKKIDKSKLKSGDSILFASVPVVFAQNITQAAAKKKEPVTHPMGPDDHATLYKQELDWRL